MKKGFLLAVAFTMVLGLGIFSAMADGPGVVVYDKAKNGVVTFDHKAHADKAGDCAACHEGTPAKIEINKESAHGAACKGCHEEKGGPTKCGECHIKG